MYVIGKLLGTPSALKEQCLRAPALADFAGFSNFRDLIKKMINMLDLNIV